MFQVSPTRFRQRAIFRKEFIYAPLIPASSTKLRSIPGIWAVYSISRVPCFGIYPGEWKHARWQNCEYGFIRKDFDNPEYDDTKKKERKKKKHEK